MTKICIRGDGAVQAGKIVAVGQNYADHAREMGGRADGGLVIFLKPASAIVGDGDAVELPEGVGEVHHEVELAVVMGSSARRVAEADAFEAILGYAVAIDVTARDLQAAAKKTGKPWTASKGFDTFFPLSECVPRDAVPDPAALHLRLKVNGAVRQDASTSAMSRSVARLVSEISDVMTLERGDLISTGTPGGVGPLVDGDTVTAELVGVVALTVSVLRRASPAR